MEFLKVAVDYGTLGILGIMSVMAFGFSIERAFFIALSTYSRTVDENLQPPKPQALEQKSALSSDTQEQKIEQKRTVKGEEAKAQKETPAIFGADYLKNPHPAYPPASKRLGEEGKVFIKVEVLADGSVGEMVIAQSSGFERLDKSALVSIKNWRFIPAKKGGQNIVSWVVVPIVFNLSK